MEGRLPPLQHRVAKNGGHACAPANVAGDGAECQQRRVIQLLLQHAPGAGGLLSLPQNQPVHPTGHQPRACTVDAAAGRFIDGLPHSAGVLSQGPPVDHDLHLPRRQ